MKFKLKCPACRHKKTIYAPAISKAPECPDCGCGMMLEDKTTDEFPDIIWLQGEDICGDWEGVTWCQDKMSDLDIRYVRTDVVISIIERHKGLLDIEKVALVESFEAV